ncbi:unnamed protein product [Psylliodes chrysocephalus]|uniref:Uncharacterized protein n=1 Tax=Psylliodes chrysocephalus TaxID=3402493 RepID=A0A9P0GKR5_9CUCU|nr:unnamed protein product [Psylliodes chrysocephala]
MAWRSKKILDKPEGGVFRPNNSRNNRFSNIVDDIKDFISDESNQGLGPYGFNSDSETYGDLPIKSKTRKKRVQVKKSTWFADRNKQLRGKGRKYYGRKREENAWNYEKTKEPRIIKPRCNCKQRSETGTMKCSLVTEDKIMQIYKDFWNMDWGQKKVYVTQVPIKRSRDRNVDTEFRRNQTLQYHLKDQCPKCASYGVGQISAEEYAIHQAKEEDARAEKTKDKEEEKIAFTVDL